jgi:hypothetical protein
LVGATGQIVRLRRWDRVDYRHCFLNSFFTVGGFFGTLDGWG